MRNVAYLLAFSVVAVIIPLLCCLYILWQAASTIPDAPEFRNSVLSTMSVLTIWGYLVLLICACAIVLAFAGLYRYFKEIRLRKLDLRQKLSDRNGIRNG